MSQLPFPSYNPTANPVSTAVVPFQPSVPQQVEIGGGTAELGAAFSQFSQTLASFAANQISTNRAKAMAEGQLKAEKSRKTFRQLVESGEIKPEENPWEALGAASADGVMAAEKFKAQTKAKYDAKVAQDPNFAISVSSAEDFVNNELQNFMTLGMQNPVWQRSAMREITPFISSLSESHGSLVAKRRRERMSDAVKISVLDFAANPTSGAAYAAKLQAQFDEHYETVGAEAANETMIQSLLKARQLSGDHPEVLKAIGMLKSGTGYLKDTKQYKAAELEQKSVIDEARDASDSKFLSSFVLDTLSSSKRLPTEAEFIKKAKERRPGMPSADIAELYGVASKNSKFLLDRYYQDALDSTVKARAQAVVGAFAVNKEGQLSFDLESNAYRDPKQLESIVRADVIRINKELGREVTDEDTKKITTNMLDQIRFQSSIQAESFASAIPLDQANRAVPVVAHSLATNTEASIMPTIRAAVGQWVADPDSKKYNEYLTYGLNIYRQGVRQRGEAGLETLGFAKADIEFFKSFDQASAGKSREDAAIAAAGRSSWTSFLPDRSVVDAAGGELVKQLGPEKAATVLESAYAEMGGLLSKDQATQFGLDYSRRVLTLPNGSVFVAPKNMTGQLVNLTNSSAIADLELDARKAVHKVSPYIDRVYFHYDARLDMYQPLVVARGETDRQARSMTRAEMEALTKAGYDGKMTPAQLASAIDRVSEKELKRRLEEAKDPEKIPMDYMDRRAQRLNQLRKDLIGPR